jgi:hypothetical protein
MEIMTLGLKRQGLLPHEASAMFRALIELLENPHSMFPDTRLDAPVDNLSEVFLW